MVELGFKWYAWSTRNDKQQQPHLTIVCSHNEPLEYVMQHNLFQHIPIPKQIISQLSKEFSEFIIDMLEQGFVVELPYGIMFLPKLNDQGFYKAKVFDHKKNKYVQHKVNYYRLKPRL
jgi:hypothetical protein